MEKLNLYDAKTHLSKIVQDVARTGEPVVIAKNGQALVKVVAYREEKPKRKLGFMLDKGTVSDSFIENFDRMNEEEIQGMFEGNDE
ncbi:type II toxin-antitoxin system prevent-host-death family antitoxin [Salmonella enterica subsp. enterica serovar Oranienburg]|nr:type II toxin-antitoxin system prevent-host-death family antitoxin [Salmonella enterica subsp. enterica serovar Oranienburg]